MKEGGKNYGKCFKNNHELFISSSFRNLIEEDHANAFKNANEGGSPHLILIIYIKRLTSFQTNCRTILLPNRVRQERKRDQYLSKHLREGAHVTERHGPGRPLKVMNSSKSWRKFMRMPETSTNLTPGPGRPLKVMNSSKSWRKFMRMPETSTNLTPE
ncbi:hypothetical protein QE152_g14075 [Popillia japonica]|uniref:Uncharacterized protein n=1 Tax=Popillia japonica TaxID=7064 RepID=A0AAW1LBX1_POPJA